MPVKTIASLQNKKASLFLDSKKQKQDNNKAKQNITK